MNNISNSSSVNKRSMTSNEKCLHSININGRNEFICMFTEIVIERNITVTSAATYLESENGDRGTVSLTYIKTCKIPYTLSGPNTNKDITI